MSDKRVYLENLFDEIRALTEGYESVEGEEDVVVLKPHEFRSFSEDLSKAIKNFLNKEVFEEDTEEDFEELEDEEYFNDEFLFDDNDDLD
jgi:hypothetical protein